MMNYALFPIVDKNKIIAPLKVFLQKKVKTKSHYSTVKQVYKLIRTFEIRKAFSVKYKKTTTTNWQFD